MTSGREVWRRRKAQLRAIDGINAALESERRISGRRIDAILRRLRKLEEENRHTNSFFVIAHYQEDQPGQPEQLPNIAW